MDPLGYDAESISEFWRAVAETGRYDQEPQTWAWQEDLQRAVELVEAERPEILVAFGCADGCRDPQRLIEAAQKQGHFIRAVFAVDCAERFEEDLRRRARELGLEGRFEFLLNE